MSEQKDQKCFQTSKKDIDRVMNNWEHWLELSKDDPGCNNVDCNGCNLSFDPNDNSIVTICCHPDELVQHPDELVQVLFGFGPMPSVQISESKASKSGTSFHSSCKA